MAEGMKQKGKRTVKPVYAVMSITGSDGKQIQGITKESVTIHSVHKNSDELLDMLDSGGLPAGTFYKRIALA
jgi:hypothetical protein